MRPNLSKEHPAAYEQMIALNDIAQDAAKSAGLDTKVIDLVKIRASQINGCAFCLRMHTRDALAAGESTDRLGVVSAWRESQYFSEVEQAALALAEEVTRIGEPGQATEVGALTPEQVSALTWVAIVINAWNRIAIRSEYPVGP